MLAFTAGSLLLDWHAARAPDERRQPADSAPRLLSDALLYGLFVLQWTNLLLAARLVADTGWASIQVPTAMFLLVISSSLCGGVASHELIHRRAAHQRWMGRLLLCSFLYEHFFTEHLRGHHARVGTGADPTTARLGESFRAYLLRALPGQLASAWRLKRERLGTRPVLRGHVRNRVLHGLLLEAALMAAFWALYGGTGLLVFLLQAAIVTVLFQAVSYCEHWGIERTTERVQAIHSWDAADGSTLFSLIGLPRHADHHMHPGRPYHLLRYHEPSPKLPRGFGGTLWLALVNNRAFQRCMTDALHRRGLLIEAPAAGSAIREGAEPRASAAPIPT